MGSDCCLPGLERYTPHTQTPMCLSHDRGWLGTSGCHLPPWLSTCVTHARTHARNACLHACTHAQAPHTLLQGVGTARVQKCRLLLRGRLLAATALYSNPLRPSQRCMPHALCTALTQRPLLTCGMFLPLLAAVLVPACCCTCPLTPCAPMTKYGKRLNPSGSGWPQRLAHHPMLPTCSYPCGRLTAQTPAKTALPFTTNPLWPCLVSNSPVPDAIP